MMPAHSKCSSCGLFRALTTEGICQRCQDCRQPQRKHATTEEAQLYAQQRGIQLRAYRKEVVEAALAWNAAREGKVLAVQRAADRKLATAASQLQQAMDEGGLP